MSRNALVKNGSFNDGTTGYTIYVDSSAKAVKTGDNSPSMAYVFGAMAGALILGVSFLKKRKNTNN